MSNRNSRLRGIVVMADNQEQAQNYFRAVASGNYRVLESKDGEYAIATANADIQIMNPVTGEEMVSVPDAEKHDLVAVASNEEDMDAFYQACSSGCGAHVISDSIELMDKCPACASDLPKMEDAELKTKTQPKELLVAVATDRVGAVAAFRALASGGCETFAAKCDDVMVISNQPINFDIYKSVEAETVDSYVPQVAVASAEGKLKVHYLTTASDSGPEMHIIASDQSPIFCPVTMQGLIDPEETMDDQQKAVASAEFANTALASDDEEDEDEEDEEFEEDEEEEEDDDEEFEEDEEEEEEEDDDDLSLGLANSAKTGKKGGVRRKKKPAVATASTEQVAATEQTAVTEPAQTEQVAAPVEVQTSFVSIASSEMKENTVDVNYVGNVQGEPTWMAFHNGIPFAKAIASAAENPATFADPAIGRAFRAIASEQGVPAALEQLRFEEIRPVLQIDSVVAEQIQSQVSEQSATLAEATARDKADLATRFESALATAATGINTGYFRGIDNPIMTALAATLESIGLSGAENLLQQAFVEHSPAYHTNIFAKAAEIMQYEQIVQNQMATAVTEIEPKNVATASSVQVGRPVQSPAQVQVQQQEIATAAAKQPQTSDFKAKLSGLKLF